MHVVVIYLHINVCMFIYNSAYSSSFSQTFILWVFYFSYIPVINENSFPLMLHFINWHDDNKDGDDVDAVVFAIFIFLWYMFTVIKLIIQKSW